MGRRWHVREPRWQSGMAVVGGIAALIFGVSSFEDAPLGGPPAGFRAFWVLMCLGIVGTGLYGLAKGGLPRAEVSEEDLAPPASHQPRSEFEPRLRSLDALHRDGVITDDEYKRKRDEIMGERW